MANLRPLAGIRVLRAVSAPYEAISGYLENLGARVDVFEEEGGLAELSDNPRVEQPIQSLANEFFHGLADKAHIAIFDAQLDISYGELHRLHPGLITMSVSDFGSVSPISDWRATDPVLHALSAELSRSGIRGRRPLLPPGQLAYECASTQAGIALVAALYRVLTGGQGAHFDFSALDGAVQALDPGFGISGSATLGRPAGMLNRDRPPRGFQYPIFPCADGFVRVCLLSKRQWRGMFKWLGEPDQFASPEFDKTINRYKSKELLPFIAKFFSNRERARLESEGQSHGVPISSLLSLEEFIDSEHIKERDALLDQREGARLPNGAIVIDGNRMGPGGENALEASFPKCEPKAIGRPLGGLKVLDLGVIVVGAEQGRLLADLGADVVKVESRSFPDGNRQSYLEHGMSVSFAAGHRNKRSLGIDLRSAEGRELFLDLVRQADVVCSNFKPGTMEKLGLGAEVLQAENPRLVISESSAFGNSGPWSNRMGYGPLVRAATGLTLAWRYEDDPDSFSDSITIYPDHTAARVCAIGVLALLIRRIRTDRGGISAVAQAEVMLSHFGREIAAGIDPASSRKPDSPWGVYPAQGDDEWCVVTASGSAQWNSLCSVIGFDNSEKFDSPEKRILATREIEGALTKWLAGLDPHEAARLLQQSGVPAAPMLRIADLPEFAHFKERGFYRTESHPWLQEEVRADAYLAKTDAIPAPPARPAPLAGEHTCEVISEWLGFDSQTIDRLCEEGVLEPLDEDIRLAAEAHISAAISQ